MTPLLDAALAAHAAGLSPIRVSADGTKRPVGSWGRWQTERPDLDQLAQWFTTGDDLGLGVVCGAVSGGLELLEFEGAAVAAGLADEFKELADAAGLGDVLGRVADGYTVRSPSGGYHLLYRCSEVAGNTKLAAEPDGPDKVRVLIETRGEGGYVVCPPSNGAVHPSGEPWEQVRGSFATIATITAAERADLLDLARSLDRMPPKPPVKARVADDGDRPGDRYNGTHDAEARTLALLERHGWAAVFQRGTTIHLRRPGKTIGTSATFGYYPGTFIPFTTSTTFEAGRGYDAFGVYAVLEHGGDWSAAASALRAEEEGTRRPKNAEKPTEPDGLVLRRASNIKPEPVEWLWPDRIPFGMLTLLVGRPDLGKTTLTMWLAGRLTRSNLWTTKPVTFIVATGEDTASTTLVPRLIAAEADLERVEFITIRFEGIEEGITIPENLPEVEEAIGRFKGDRVCLVMDPVAAHLSGTIDSHRDHQVRRALTPVAKLAEHTGAAIVGIGHLNKALGGDVLSRIVGSVGFGGAPRSVLLLGAEPGSDPTTDSRRVLIHGKCNVAKKAVPLRFEVGGVTVDGGIPTSKLVNKGEARGVTAADVLGRTPAGDDDQTKLDEAVDWLRDVLSEGPQLGSEIKKWADMEGIAERTLQRARLKVSAVTERDATKRGRPSIWTLPDYVPSPDGTKPLARNRTDPKPLQDKGSDPEPFDYVPRPGAWHETQIEAVVDGYPEACFVCETVHPLGTRCAPPTPRPAPIDGELEAPI